MRKFHESFDVLTPTQLAQVGKWESVGSGVVSVTGRTGLGVTGTTGASQADNTLRTRKIFPGTSVVGFHGWATKFSSNPASEQPVWGLIADDGTRQLTLTIATNGTAKIYRGSMETGTLLGQSTLTFVTSAFRYLEVGYRLDLGGRVEVRSIPASGTARQLVVMGGTSTRSWMQSEFYLTDEIIIDDPYVNDATFNPGYFSGDVTIEAYLPAEVVSEGLSAPLRFTVSTGPDTGPGKVDMVDDPTLDGDLTYIYARRNFALINYRMSTVAPSDGRRVDEMLIHAICRRTSTTPPTPLSPVNGRVNATDFRGITYALHDPNYPETIVGTGYQVKMYPGGPNGRDGALTIDRVNAARFSFGT